MFQDNHHPPIPPDMLQTLRQLIDRPESPRWRHREMILPEGTRDLVIGCEYGPNRHEGEIAHTVLVRAVQWAAAIPGQDRITAQMLVGQCQICKTIYWHPTNDWTRFLMLRFIVENQVRSRPLVLVPDKRIIS